MTSSKNFSKLSILFFFIILCFSLPNTTHSAVVSSSAQPANLSRGLVGWWTMDSADLKNNVTDKSGNGNNGSLVGFGATSTAIAKGRIGQGLTFNGTTQFVDLGIPSSLNLASANKFTLSAWVYPTSAPNGVGVISEMYTSSNQTVQYEIGFDQDNGPGVGSKLAVGFYDTAGGGWHILKDSGNIPLNAWVFITGTWDGTSLKLYKNGVLINSSTPGGALPATFFDKIVIGKRHDTAGTTNFFPGKIDDARIYNRTLSASEIKQLYNYSGSIKVNSTPTTTSGDTLKNGLVGYWTFDGADLKNNVADKSGLGNTAYMSGFTSTSSAITAGKMGQGLKFDGVDDYIKTENYSFINAENVPHSMFAWVYPKDTTNGAVVSYGEFYDTNYSTGIGLKDGNLVRMHGYGSHAYGIPSGLTVPLNKWSFIGFTRTPTQTIFYVNNTNATIDDVVDNTIFTNNPIVIGATNWNASLIDYFNGSIDDVHVYNRAVTPSEVTRLYNLGSTKVNTTPALQAPSSTGKPNLSTGLVGWWTFDGKNLKNNVADSSGNGNHGRLVNFGATSTAVVQGKLGQGLKFDGVDDYMNIGPMPSLDGLSQLTISFWIKPVTLENQTFYFFRQANVDPTNHRLGMMNNGSGGETFFYIGNGLDSYSRGTYLTTGVWQLFTMVFDGSQPTNETRQKIYINGIPKTLSFVNTIPATTPDLSSTIDFYIGSSMWPSPGQFPRESMDDVRIYNRALSASEVKQLYNAGK